MRSLALLLCCASLASGATLYRIACGSQGGTDPAGNVWTADTLFVGGGPWTVANQPALASQPVPYQALRYSNPPGTPFSYSIPLPPGQYVVTLKFMEPNKTAAGQRVFSASVGGAVAYAALDLFSEVGALVADDKVVPITTTASPLVISFAAATGNAVLSGIQIDSVTPPPPSGIQIACTGGTVASTDITATAPNQEITIMSAVPANFWWDHVTVCETTRFLGRSALALAVSMGRPGTDDIELTGAPVQLEQSSGNANCWSTRPIQPAHVGPYDIVLNFTATITDPNGTAQIPAPPPGVSNLTDGLLTWEACGYNSLIGAPPAPLVPAAKLAAVQQCAGSGGKGSDCTGLVWAAITKGDGSTLSVMGAPAPPPVATPGVTWSAVK
jgi:malectin (di-glucose binding ER protein)